MFGYPFILKITSVRNYMFKRTVNWRSVSFGLVHLTVSLAIIFLLPIQIFLFPWKGNFDWTFQGLALIFGEFGARYFFALPFLLMSFASFKQAFSDQNKSIKSVFPSRLRGRKSREKVK